MTYRMTDRFFSRLWRRTKRYSEHELRWLARKHGLTLHKKREQIMLVGPKTCVHFQGEGTDAPTVPSGKLVPINP